MGEKGKEKDLEGEIGYPFRDRALLEEALTHSSFANETGRPGTKNNERLEFLGDAVLGLAAADYLVELFPDAREGKLSRMRSSLVEEKWLARAGERLGLGDCLLLGRGEETSGGRDKPSILSGAVEALVGAVYRDGGWAAASLLARRLFPDPGEAATALSSSRDAKTRLQELCQERHRGMPSYRLVSQSGPPHSPRFTVSVSFEEEILAEGRGLSKKAAEQEAAAKAVEIIAGSEEW